MPTLEELGFELERRVILFKSSTTMPDGSSLGFNADPNTAINGATPGQTLIYNCPVGTRYQQDDGTQWYKKTLPNTWSKFGDGGGSGGGNILYGNNPPSLLTVPPTASPQFYIDLSTIPTKYMTILWTYTTGTNWYPTACCWKAKHFNEEASILSSIEKFTTKLLTDNISIDDSNVKLATKGVSELLSITTEKVKIVAKGLSEGVEIEDTALVKTDLKHQDDPVNVNDANVFDIQKQLYENNKIEELQVKLLNKYKNEGIQITELFIIFPNNSNLINSFAINEGGIG